MSPDVSRTVDLMRAASRSYRTISGTFRTWENAALAQAAYDSRRHPRPRYVHPPSPPCPVDPAAEGTPRRRTVGKRFSFYATSPAPFDHWGTDRVRPSRLRLETSRVLTDGIAEPVELLVVNGEDYLRVFPADGRGTRGRGPQGPAIADHSGLPWILNPEWFAEDDRLRVTGVSVIAGRTAMLLGKPVTRRKRQTYPVLGWRGFDETEYTIAVDAERGILLRIAECLRGEEFRTIEIDQVRFDAHLNAALFDLSASGIQLSEESDVHPQDATPEDAARHLGFTVFVPRTLPFQPYVRRGLKVLAPGAAVSQYFPAEGLYALGYGKRLPATRQFTSALTWMQSRAPLEEPSDGWDTARVGGLEFRTRELYGSDGKPWIQAQVDREGTWILALAALDREQVMQLILDARRVAP